MNLSRMKWMLFCAALALPATAWAQHGHAPGAPAAPAAPKAPQAPEVPEDFEHGHDYWLALGADSDELFAEGDALWMAQGGPAEGSHRRMKRHGMHAQARRGMHMQLSKLDLTDAQRDKMRDLHEAAARKHIQREADMKVARLDLHKLMRADAPSAQAVNAQIDKLAKLRADGMKAHFETRLQARALLTPEQLKKLKAAPGHGGSMMLHEGPGDPEGGSQ